MKTDVWTLSAYSNSQEEGFDENSQRATLIYESQEDAEEHAKTWAEEISKWLEPEVFPVIVSILVGEYKTESGDIYGEPTAIGLYKVGQDVFVPFNQKIDKITLQLKNDAHSYHYGLNQLEILNYELEEPEAFKEKTLKILQGKKSYYEEETGKLLYSMELAIKKIKLIQS